MNTSYTLEPVDRSASSFSFDIIAVEPATHQDGQFRGVANSSDLVEGGGVEHTDQRLRHPKYLFAVCCCAQLKSNLAAVLAGFQSAAPTNSRSAAAASSTWDSVIWGKQGRPIIRDAVFSATGKEPGPSPIHR